MEAGPEDFQQTRLIYCGNQLTGAAAACEKLVRQQVCPAVKIDAEQSLNYPLPETQIRLQLEGIINCLDFYVHQLWHEA